MKEWVVESKAIEGTEVWDVFSQYKQQCEKRGEKAIKSGDMPSGNHYYLRFLDWVPMTTKEYVDEHTQKDIEIVEIPPDTLEACMEKFLSRGWNRNYQHRFRNINTGEIIPTEVLCE